MSAPLDVLAVMEQTALAYADLRAKEGRGAVLADDLLEARAAVAELVEAVSAIKAKRGGTMALGATDARTVRLLAALAKFGGAA